MRFVILTGMSGAGKSTALKMLEDMGYFCVDNLPLPLMERFAAFVMQSEIYEGRNIALGVDIRSGRSLTQLDSILHTMTEHKILYEILFLDASDETLVKRYKETRRSHPLSGGGRIEKGIQLERTELKFLKKNADYIIDTSHLLTRELRQELEKIFVENRKFSNMMISVLTFGFKYGIPDDADLVFDVRFLPNPYYVEELKNHTGNEKIVRDYVMNSKAATEFLDKLTDMIEFLVPNYALEGKTHLVIAIGCTGGRHRSVTLANELYERLQLKEEYGVKLEHRDIDRDHKNR